MEEWIDKINTEDAQNKIDVKGFGKLKRIDIVMITEEGSRRDEGTKRNKEEQIKRMK